MCTYCGYYGVQGVSNVVKRHCETKGDLLCGLCERNNEAIADRQQHDLLQAGEKLLEAAKKERVEDGEIVQNLKDLKASLFPPWDRMKAASDGAQNDQSHSAQDKWLSGMELYYRFATTASNIEALVSSSRRLSPPHNSCVTMSTTGPQNPVSLNSAAKSSAFLVNATTTRRRRRRVRRR